MEKVRFTFEGNLIDVDVIDGEFLFSLPIETQDGEIIHSFIERKDKQWMYYKTSNTDSSKIIVLSDDDEVTVLDGGYTKVQDATKLDLHKENPSDVERCAMRLFDFRQRYMFRTLTGFDPKDIVDARKMEVTTLVDRFGRFYDEQEEKIKLELGMFSLRELGDILENYSHLPYVEPLDLGNGTTSIRVNVPKNMGMRDFIDTITDYKIASKEMRDEYLDQVEDVGKFRGLVTDYRLTMPSSLREEEKEKYLKVGDKVLRLILGLNYDLLSDKLKEEVEDLSGLSLIERQDKISEVIDSKEFAEATNIEDRYVIKEDEIMTMEIDSLGFEDSRVKDTNIGIEVANLRRKAIASRTKRTELAEKYEKMKKLYDAKVITIKDTKDYGKKEREEYDD